jgi:hypothetical protein
MRAGVNVDSQLTRRSRGKGRRLIRIFMSWVATPQACPGRQEGCKELAALPYLRGFGYLRGLGMDTRPVPSGAESFLGSVGCAIGTSRTVLLSSGGGGVGGFESVSFMGPLWQEDLLAEVAHPDLAALTSPLAANRALTLPVGKRHRPRV